MPRLAKATWPANVPLVPPEAERYDEVRGRQHYTVYDSGPYRWRFTPRGLATFIKYGREPERDLPGLKHLGGIVRIIQGPAYKPPTHREGIHVVSDLNDHCVRCGCSREARQDNLPHTKTCTRA